MKCLLTLVLISVSEIYSIIKLLRGCALIRSKFNEYLSCSFLNNYMVVTSGKILWGILYPCACASWVTWDYQVSSKFLSGTSPFTFDVMVAIREGVRDRWRIVHHTWVQALWVKANWAPSVYTSGACQEWHVCKIFPLCSPLLRSCVPLSGY